MGVSADAPYLDSAYKLVAYNGRPVMKLSAGKATQPGAKQAYRGPAGDILALRDEPPPAGHQPLLRPVMRHGKRITPAEPLAVAQRRCADSLAWLPPAARALKSPVPPPVRTSAALAALRQKLARELRRHAAAGAGGNPTLAGRQAAGYRVGGHRPPGPGDH
jgi:nicotinate phosphoribosyltransferase